MNVKRVLIGKVVFQTSLKNQLNHRFWSIYLKCKQQNSKINYNICSSGFSIHILGKLVGNLNFFGCVGTDRAWSPYYWWRSSHWSGWAGGSDWPWWSLTSGSRSPVEGHCCWQSCRWCWTWSHCPVSMSVLESYSWVPSNTARWRWCYTLCNGSHTVPSTDRIIYVEVSITKQHVKERANKKVLPTTSDSSYIKNSLQSFYQNSLQLYL